MKDRRELGLKEKSGVLFHRKISWMYKGKKENTFFSYLLELILIFLTAFGMLFGFAESLEIQVDKQALFIGIILFTILFQFAFVIKGITKYAVAVLSIGWLVSFFLFFTQIKQGFIVVANQIVYSINYYYDINLLEFHSLPEETTYFCTVLLLFVAFMAIGIIGWVVCGKGLRIFYILATFPFIMMPFLVGVIPNEFLLISYSLAAITILGNGFRLQTDIRMKVRKILFLFSLILFTLVYLLFPPKSYQNNINLEQVKIQLQKKAREFSESDILNDIFHGGLFSKVSIASGGLSNGKLGRVSEVKFQKKTDLILTVPYKMRDSFYVRGYIGADYTKDGWTQPKDSDDLDRIEKQYPEGFDNLTNQWMKLYNNVNVYSGHYYRNPAIRNPAIEMTDSYGFIDWFKQSVIKPEEIIINNVGANKENLFAPYFLEEKVEIQKDGKLHVKGYHEKKEYSFYTSYKMNYLLGTLILKENDFCINYAVDSIQKNIMNRNYLEKLLGGNLKDMEEELEGYSDNSVLSWPTVKELSKNEEDIYNSFYGDVEQSIKEAIVQCSAVDDYATKENIYRSYVYNEYTKLPQSGAEQTIQYFEKFKTQTKWKDMHWDSYKTPEEAGTYSFKELYEKIKVVKDYLKESTQYSLSPGALPKGKDFIDYFLFENKKGYCSHYASAAVIMFRAMGIPSRYVEGYVVTTDDIKAGTRLEHNIEIVDETGNVIKESKENAKKILKIKDTNAHAWAEIYLDGFGWMPVETTVGYNGTMEYNGNVGGYEYNVNLPNEIKNPGQTEESIQNGKKPGGSNNTVKPTKPPMGETDSSSEGKGNNKKSVLVDYILKIGLILAILLIISALWFLQRYLVIYKRKKKILKGEDKNKQLLFWYEQVHKVLIYLCHLKKEEDLWEHLDTIEQMVPYLNSEELLELIELAKKAAFGQDCILEVECIKAKQFYKKFIDSLYKNSTKKQQLFYKYVKVFY